MHIYTEIVYLKGNFMNEGAHLRKALIFINKLTYYYITKNLINLLLEDIFHFYF